MQFSLGMDETLFLKMHKYPPRPSLSWGPLSVIVPVVESLGGISTLTPVVCKISAMVFPRWPITYLCCDFGTSTDTNVHFFSYNYKNTLTQYIQVNLHAFIMKMFCSVLNRIPELCSPGSTSKLTINKNKLYKYSVWHKYIIFLVILYYYWLLVFISMDHHQANITKTSQILVH